MSDRWSTEPADRTVNLQVTLDGKVLESLDLTPEEALAFFITPTFQALDDGDASWEMQEDEPERHNELYGRVSDLHLEVYNALRIEADRTI